MAWTQIDPVFASRAVRLSLHCVGTESPHYREPEAEPGRSPRESHPAFYGCYDWHSAVHGHWAMLRLLNRLERLPERQAIVAALDRHLTPANLREERAFLERHPGFEEPYGWAWLLRLAEELRASGTPEAKRWAEAVAPLEELLSEYLRSYMSRTAVPYRKGLHRNSAYALAHAWDYARSGGHEPLRLAVEEAALRWFGQDRDCDLSQEPEAHDFLSPCFTVADLMRRVLPAERFAAWFRGFLPRLSPEQLRPVPPADLEDSYQVHLVGLMYSKAAAMGAVARTLESGDPRRGLLEQAERAQVETAASLMFRTNYGGTHWLASFAIFYHTGAGR